MSDFKAWYKANKDKVSEKRKKRYAEDAEYRERMKNNARKARGISAAFRKPDGYSMYLAQVAKYLEITEDVLQYWRKKDYYPEPFVFEGHVWFTSEQILWLDKLKDFFQENNSRSARDTLEDLVSMIYANW